MKYIVTLLLFSSCTNETAYEMLHPGNVKEVSKTYDCWRSGRHSHTKYIENGSLIRPIDDTINLYCKDVPIKICVPDEVPK
mgnify:CR=1 FL=1